MNSKPSVPQYRILFVGMLFGFLYNMLPAYSQQPCPLNRIYFVSAPAAGGPSTIWYMDTLGKKRVRLFSDSYHRQALAISKDYKMMAYTKRLDPNNTGGGGQLWICTNTMEGTNEIVRYLLPEHANTDIRHLDFNHAGTTLLFDKYLDGYPAQIRDGDLFTLDLGTNVITQLTNTPNFGKFAGTWSPDDSKISFTYLSSGWLANPIPGRLMNANGTNITPINPLNGGNYGNTISAGFKWSPDGTMFVFSHHPSVGANATMYIMRTDGSQLRSLNYTSSSLLEYVYNPEGSRLAIGDFDKVRLINTDGLIGTTILKGVNAYFRDLNWVIYQKKMTPSLTSADICAGQAYWGYTTTGVFTDMFKDADGCDSIRTLNLTVNPGNSATINQSICAGKSFLGYTTTGTYRDTLIGSNGCDSIRILNLTVKPGTNSTINETICAGKSFLGYTTTGTYRDTLIGSNGCDSIRILNLTVKPGTNSTINETICTGKSFLGYATTGTYRDTLIGSNGCDSIRILNLTVRPLITSLINKTICDGQIFLGRAASGVFTDTLLSSNGCDSLRTLNLTVLPRVQTSIDTTVCSGQSVFGHTQTGIYRDTLTTIFGCDSIRIVRLIVSPRLQPNLGADKSICTGDSILLNPGNFTNYRWSNGSQLKTQLVSTQQLYSVTVFNELACSATDSFQLISLLPKPAAFLPDKYEKCKGEVITIPGYENYLWSNGVNSASITINTAGLYTLRVTDRYGCIGTDTVQMIVESCSEVFIPSAFTPNGDGINDSFKPLIRQQISNFQLQIFSRWGEQIFTSTNPSPGWQGYYKGKPLPSGGYAYLLKFTDATGMDYQKSGTVVLIR